MGGLADLLMGIGNRAAEVKRRDEDRAYKESSQGRQLSNEAIMDRLKDPTLPYEEQQRIAGILEENNKMKKGSLSAIFDQARQLHPHLEKLMGQGQQPMPPIPSMGADKTYSASPSSSMQFEAPITVQGGRFAGQQAPAVAQPNVQMQGLPQFQQLSPMPQPPVGLAPQGRSPAGFNQQGKEEFAPRSEMERMQGARQETLQRQIANLKSMGASPETINDTIRASAGISPVAQAAMIRAGSAENVAKINATAKMLAAGGNSGHFVTVQEPGETIPKTVFQIEKGSHAGTMVEPNSMEPAQLKPGFKKLFDHPDQLSLQTDKEGNVSVVNATQGKVTASLGPIGKPGNVASGTGTYRPMYDNAGKQVGWVNSKDPSDFQPMAEPGMTAAKPAEASVTKFDQLATMTDQMNQLHKFSNMPTVQDAIGPMAGRVTDWTRGLVDKPDEVNEAFRIVSDLSDMLLRARSGAQINEQEYSRLRKIIPNPNTPLKRFQSDLNGFTKELNVVLKRRGMPLVGESKESGSSVGGNGINLKPPAPPAGTVIEGYRFKGGSVNDRNNWEPVQ